jgi:two-component system LytT family response regulator
MLLRAIIVDDEPLARERLRTLLNTANGVTIVSECASGADALVAIQALRPDTVFLDVQMPEMDGFEVVRRIGDTNPPMIIFCTAHDEFAVRAFEANAIDYLLKPVDRDRLDEAVARAKSRVKTGPFSFDGSSSLPPVLAADSEGRDRFAVKKGNHFVVVRTEEILWIEGADNYVVFHTRDATHRFRSRISEIEESLRNRDFLRIHRSTIINVDEVQVIEAWGMGEFLFQMSSGEKLVSSRRYRNQIRSVFGC